MKGFSTSWAKCSRSWLTIWWTNSRTSRNCSKKTPICATWPWRVPYCTRRSRTFTWWIKTPRSRCCVSFAASTLFASSSTRSITTSRRLKRPTSWPFRSTIKLSLSDTNGTNLPLLKQTALHLLSYNSVNFINIFNYLKGNYNYETLEKP